MRGIEGQTAAFGEFATDQGRVLSAALHPKTLHLFPTAVRVRSPMLELMRCWDPRPSPDLFWDVELEPPRHLSEWDRIDQLRGDETESSARHEINLLPRALEWRLVQAALHAGALPRGACTTLVVYDQYRRFRT